MTLLAAIVAWRNKFLTGKQTNGSSDDFDEQLY
jgi:hypothetical protein